jgi:hypothetical protein
MNRVFTIGNSRAALMKALSLLGNLLVRPEDDLELIVRKRVYKRTPEQNRRYWGVVLQEISEGLPVQGVIHTPKAWHYYFAGKFIGYEDTKLPNGKVVTEPISTTSLDVPEFSDYMTKIEAWAAGHGLLFSEDRMAA